MRLIALFALALLAGCARNTALRTPDTHVELSKKRPTVAVADAALAAGAPDVALNIANGLLQDRPGDSDARLRKGQAEYRLGDIEEARASFTMVLARQPRSFEAQLGLGWVELATDAAAAQARFEHLIAIQPNNPAALTDLGIAYDLLGQHDLAQKMYRAALTVAPDLVSARSNLALSLTLADQPGGGRQASRPVDATPSQSAQNSESATGAYGLPPAEPPTKLRPVGRNAGS